MSSGCTFWLTGLSNTGKTTIAKELYRLIKAEKDNVVFLDGDELREVFGLDLGYDCESRKKSAMRNARICKLLSGQDIIVICATISMWNDVRDWNRKNIENYYEIYIKAPLEILMQRDSRGVYDNNKNVWGLDISAEEPKSPDLVIVNNGTQPPKEFARIIKESFYETR